MKFSVFAEAFTGGIGDTNLGIDSTLVVGDGFPVTALDSGVVTFYGASTLASATYLVFKLNSRFNSTNALPVIAIKLIDAVKGTTTVLPTDITVQQVVNEYAVFTFTGDPMTVGERVEIEIEIDDSLILPPTPSEIALISPIMTSII